MAFNSVGTHLRVLDANTKLGIFQYEVKNFAKILCGNREELPVPVMSEDNVVGKLVRPAGDIDSHPELEEAC